jgi:hypothetical protein
VKQCDKGSEAAERYVDGSMGEPERTGFEDHFFACNDCFLTVQALEDAGRVLGETDSPETGLDADGNATRFPLGWMAAAAMLIIVVGLSLMVRPESEPARLPAAQVATADTSPARPEPVSSPATPVPPPPGNPLTALESRERRLEHWAVVVPPQYVSLTTRSASNEGADESARLFEEAMTHYSAGRYGQAADGLQALAERAPDAAHVHFFLGISELMSGNVARARGALQRSADASAGPYSDEAHFYLAKAAVREGDLTTAARELEIAVEREAGPTGEAARLLAEMRKVGR